MNKYLIKLADHLDKKGLHKEADYVDWIIKSARVLVEPVTTVDKCPEDNPCPGAPIIGNLLTHKTYLPNGKVEKSYEFKPKDEFKNPYPSFKGSENLIGVGQYKNLKVMIFEY